MQDPKLHSHIEDVLSDDHNLAFENIFCSICGEMLHALINECMQTWVETGHGNFCIACFAKVPNVSELNEKYGLVPNGEDKLRR